MVGYREKASIKGSIIKGKKEDRRIRRTRDLLQDALIHLMIEKGYEAVTVQDIIDRANVGRSTFYSHFYDKEQLLISNIARLGEFLKQQQFDNASKDYRDYDERSEKDSKRSDEIRFGFSLAMFQHVQSHKPLYEATVSKNGALVLPHMQRMFEEVTRDEITNMLSLLDGTTIPQELTVKFVVNTFFSLLAWWSDSQMPLSAEEMDRIFHKLVLNGIGVKPLS